MRFEIVMDPRTKENRHLRTALAESWNECGSMTKTIVSLEERLDALRQERDDEKRRHGEEMCERDDVIAEQKKTIASLEHRLAMRSNVDSSSGKDPIEYESNKHFHNAVEAHEAAKKNGEQPPESVTPKQCGGQPGHPGKSHDIKPDGLKIYTAELCGGCGMAVSEMLKPIYKLVQDKGLDEQSKNAYTAKVTFGWCDACEDVTDPAPHLTWGTSFEGRVMAATLQYKSNPQGRTTIVDNLDAIHGFKVARSTVSNAITAAACRLEGRVRPDSVAKFIRKKMEAKAAAAAEASQVSETAQAAQPPQATETATHTAQAAQPPQATETATHTAQAAQPPQATETATHTAQAAQPPQATETATHTAQAAQPPQATETATHTAQAAQPPQATETATHTAQAAQPPQATETATHTAQAAQPPQATETATHTAQAAQPPQATETATHTAQAAQPPQATETATHTAQAAQPPQATETAPQTDKTPVGMLEYVPSGKPARKTKAELAAEDLDVPHAQTPQGVTDARLACNTTSYPGSHKLSFMEWCREYLTIAPYMGIDESKYVVAGKWCHAIVIVSPSVAMIQVRRHKNRKVINRMFGGMRNRIVIHDRISIYNGFKWIHIECWVHLIRRFFVPAKKNGIGSPEYDRYIMILELYGRLKKLAERVAERVGTPDNAAEMAACQHEIKKIWKEFEPEHNAILNGLHALIDDLGDQDPVTYLKNMMPRIMAAVKCPGAPPHNNPPEQSVRWNVVRTRHISGALPNWRAARNYGTIQTFSATCRKKGTTVYRAVQEMLKTPDWNVFTAGIPPPIFPHMA